MKEFRERTPFVGNVEVEASRCEELGVLQIIYRVFPKTNVKHQKGNVWDMLLDTVTNDSFGNFKKLHVNKNTKIPDIPTAFI